MKSFLVEGSLVPQHSWA